MKKTGNEKPRASKSKSRKTGGVKLSTQAFFSQLEEDPVKKLEVLTVPQGEDAPAHAPAQLEETPEDALPAAEDPNPTLIKTEGQEEPRQDDGARPEMVAPAVAAAVATQSPARTDTRPRSAKLPPVSHSPSPEEQPQQAVPATRQCQGALVQEDAAVAEVLAPVQPLEQPTALPQTEAAFGSTFTAPVSAAAVPTAPPRRPLLSASRPPAPAPRPAAQFKPPRRGGGGIVMPPLPIVKSEELMARQQQAQHAQNAQQAQQHPDQPPPQPPKPPAAAPVQPKPEPKPEPEPAAEAPHHAGPDPLADAVTAAALMERQTAARGGMSAAIADIVAAQAPAEAAAAVPGPDPVSRPPPLQIDEQEMKVEDDYDAASLGLVSGSGRSLGGGGLTQMGDSEPQPDGALPLPPEPATAAPLAGSGSRWIADIIQQRKKGSLSRFAPPPVLGAPSPGPAAAFIPSPRSSDPRGPVAALDSRPERAPFSPRAAIMAAAPAAAALAAAAEPPAAPTGAMLSPGAFDTPLRSLPGARESLAPAPGSARPDSAARPGSVATASPLISPGDLELNRYLSGTALEAMQNQGGVEALYPWQAACLRAGGDEVLRGRSNLVLTAPTSAGKTLIAEVLILRALAWSKQHAFRKALVVLPYQALCSQFARRFGPILRAALELEVRESHGGHYSRALWEENTGVVVCTFESAARVLHETRRRDRRLCDDFCCVIVDEVHMLVDEGRGGGLEMLIAKFLYEEATIRAEEVAAAAAAAAAAVAEPGSAVRAGAPAQALDAPVTGATATFGSTKSRRAGSSAAGNSGDLPTSLQAVTTSTPPGPVGSDCLAGRKVQIVAMSATMPPAAARRVAAWLGAALYESDFRPVPLFRFLKKGNELLAPAGQDQGVEPAPGAPPPALVPVRCLPPPAPWDPHHVGHLVDETVQEGHSVLVFCGTKNECVKFAGKLAQKLTISDRSGLPPPPLLERTPGGEDAGEAASIDEDADFEAEERSRWSREGVARALEALGGQLGPRLAGLVRAGVAYHNSDLPPQYRALVEGAYTSRAISVLCATSTLAAGVNLPARRVILKDGFQGLAQAANVIKPELYLQMAGRAGRTGEGDRGEAVLVHNPGGPATLAHLEALIHARTPTLADYVAVGDARLRQLLLDLVVSVGDTYSANIEQYMACLVAAQDTDTEKRAALIADIQGALNHLSGAGLRAIEWVLPLGEGAKGFFRATARGQALAASGLPLEEALAMERELQETNDQGLIGSSDLQACYLCVPPRFMPREPLKLEQWRHFCALLKPLQRDKSPENNVLRLLGIDPNFVGRMTCPGASPDADTLRRHQRFYYALALHAFVQGASLEAVLRDFNLKSVKNVAAMPEDATATALKAKAYCEALGDGWDMLAAALERFGRRISPLAVTAALVEVKGVGPASAKALLVAGIVDPATLAVASEADVVRALRRLGKPGGMEGEPAERVRAEWIARARQMQLEARRSVKPEALKAAIERQAVLKAVAAKQKAQKKEKSQKRDAAAAEASPVKRPRREEAPAEAAVAVAAEDVVMAPMGGTDADDWAIFDQMERERSAKGGGGGGNGDGRPQKRKAGEGSEDGGPAGNDGGENNGNGNGNGGNDNGGGGGGDAAKGLPTIGVVKIDKIARVRSLVKRLRRLGSFSAQFDIYDPLQGVDVTAAYAAAAASAAKSLAPMPPPRRRSKSHLGSTAVPGGPGALLDADLDGAEAVAGAAAAAAANPNAPPVAGAVMGLALSWASGVAAYVPLHPSLGCHRDEVGSGFHAAAAAALGELLADSSVEVAWNGWKRQVGATRWLLACAPGGAGARAGAGLAAGMLDVALAAWMTQPDPDMVRFGSAAEPQDLSQKDVQEELERRRRAMEGQPALVSRVAFLVGMWDGGWDGVTPILETMAAEEKKAEKEREKARKRSRSAGGAATAAALSGTSFVLNRSSLAACTAAALISGAHRRVMARLESYAAEGDSDMLRALRDQEMPIVPMLHDMERHGAGINVSSLEALKKKLEERRTAVERAAIRAAKHDFSLSSTTEVAALLYNTDKLNIPKVRGNSTAKDVLLEIQKGPYRHDVIPLIIEYRRLVKALGDLAGHLDKARQALARGGPAPAGSGIVRVPTKWHQAATATGRFAMGDSFNLICMHKAFEIEQSGDADDETLLANMRAAVVPAAPGRVMLSADFGQFELRLLAGFSGDERLQAMVADGGEDPFRALAASWRRLPPASISAQLRDQTKQIIYALIYGMGDSRLAESLNVDIRVAEKLRKEFLETFPGVSAWMDKVKRECTSDGFVRTLAGRRRWLPSIRSQTWGVRAAAERAAINTVVQGSAADVAKAAMVAVERTLEERGLCNAATLVLNIHDELLFEVDEGAVHAVAAVVRECMEGAAPGLGVPLRVKVRVGPSWGELGPAMEL